MRRILKKSTENKHKSELDSISIAGHFHLAEETLLSLSWDNNKSNNNNNK